MRKERVYFQCLKCGEVNEIDSKYTPKEDEIYVDLYCPHCGRLARQLYCYDDEDDLSIYTDVTLDKRYY